MKEIEALKEQAAAAEQSIDAAIGDDEVVVRVRAMLPALMDFVAGRPSRWIDRIRRNVALRAEAQGIDLLRASGRELLGAQGGVRLEARQFEKMAWDIQARTEAPPFVPNGGVWGPLGRRCTCGAIAYSSHDGPPPNRCFQEAAACDKGLRVQGPILVPQGPSAGHPLPQLRALWVAWVVLEAVALLFNLRLSLLVDREPRP